MIEEQKQIMRDLGVKLKEPQSPVKKPVINLPESYVKKPVINSPESAPLPNKIEQPIKIYNFNEIKKYKIEGDNFLLYITKSERITKVRLDNGNIINIEKMNTQEKEILSEELSEDEKIVIPGKELTDYIIHKNNIAEEEMIRKNELRKLKGTTQEKK